MAGLAGGGARRDSSGTAQWVSLLERLTPDYVEASPNGHTSVAGGRLQTPWRVPYLHHARMGPIHQPAETAGGCAASLESGIGSPSSVLYSLAIRRAPPRLASADPQQSDGFERLSRERGAARRLPAPVGGALFLRAVGFDDLAALRAWPTDRCTSTSPSRRKRWRIAAPLTTAPNELLAETVVLDERWCLIHATHAEPHEVDLIARNGAVAGLCPVTEANLGDGVFDATRFLDRRGRLGVGSDSLVRISAAEELRALEYAQRLRHRSRNALGLSGLSTGRRLHDAACAGGGRALGRAVGALAPGRRADIVGSTASTPRSRRRAAMPFSTPGLSATRGGRRRDLRGVHLVSAGRHHGRERCSPAIATRRRLEAI